MSSHLCPFALWTAFPSSLVGRCFHDYYGHSVAMGLAPRRRSRVRPCRTSERDVGVPLISLIALAGQRSTLRRCDSRETMPSQSVTSVSDAFPTDGFLRLLEIGLSSNQAFAISRGSRDASTRHLGLTVAFLAGDGPVHLSDPGKAIGPKNLLRVLPGCTGNTTERLAAHFP